MLLLKKLNRKILIFLFLLVIFAVFLIVVNLPYKQLEETGSSSDSTSDQFWLDSGGFAYLQKKRIKSIQGELKNGSKWQKSYEVSNPVDTDNGQHPQNVFRLIYSKKLFDFEQSAFFKINKVNPSNSPNRNLSNGILFFSRYIDSDNLYYSGLRVDGHAIIKKKVNGEYITLAEKEIFAGEYDQNDNPNLIPENQWIGIKSDIFSSGENVKLRLYKFNNLSNNWDLILELEDDNPISNSGFPGIRTDFLDFECKDYTVSAL